MVFQVLDVDKSGALTFVELREAFDIILKMNLSEEEFETAAAEMDRVRHDQAAEERKLQQERDALAQKEADLKRDLVAAGQYAAAEMDKVRHAQAAEEQKLQLEKDRNQGVSNAMRDRLISEMKSQGADPNTSAGNPILLISGVVAVLALVVVGLGYAD